MPYFGVKINISPVLFSGKHGINEFQPFKAPGPDGLYPVLLQKGWNQLKGYYHVIFQACLRTAMSYWHGKNAHI